MKHSNLTRRTFLQSTAGSLVYFLSQQSASSQFLTRGERLERVRGRGGKPGVNPTEWIRIGADGQITVYSGRNELGQGLRTVIYDLLTQAFELPPERITLTLGDTGLCPNDGPTTGSTATRFIGWSFWRAAFQIRYDLVQLAAEALGQPPEELSYREGYIFNRARPEKTLGIGDIARDYVPTKDSNLALDTKLPQYIDKGLPNVDADDIVTGKRMFAGDWHVEGARYGALIVPDFHDIHTEPLAVDTSALGKDAGDIGVHRMGTHVAVIGESFHSVQQAQSKIRIKWRTPEEPQQRYTGDTLRAHCKLVETIADTGLPDEALRSAPQKIVESYSTQHASQVPLETDTALVYREGDNVIVRVGSQAPFVVRYKVANALGLDPEKVRVICSPAGGAFGSKTNHTVGEETTLMAALAGGPIKHVYTRKADIQSKSQYKQSVIVDLASGVNDDGKLVARTIDIYQDMGHGTERLYNIENKRTRLYGAFIQVRHAIMRGTSYTQNVYALESHTESVARKIGMDVLDFRRKNIFRPEFLPLIDRCEELLEKRTPAPNILQGVGYGICLHSTKQYAVIGAQVSVEPNTGVVSVDHLVGTFDIGMVVNRNTTTMGVKGAMIWGLGAALLEEVDLDGHRCYTSGFADYRIARMRDVPGITVDFLNATRPGRPHGCGEMPLPPTIAAIANAVADAIGERIYSIPITPEKVREALARKQANLARHAEAQPAARPV